MKLRGIAVAFAFGALTVTLIPVQWLALRFGWSLRRSLPVSYHRLVCRLVGVRIKEIGARAAETPLLIAANHVSWLDIVVLSAVAPVVFVAKSEVASWPLFGLLAKLQRSVFVDRVRRQKTADATREIAGRLAEGDAVVLFAEGTSSDGNRVLPFRSSLIGAAHAALGEGRDTILVQPLAIAYVRMGGFPLGRRGRPRIAWYGDMTLGPHLFGVMSSGDIDVTVAWGTPMPCDAAADRKDLARRLEAEVRRLADEARAAC